MKGVGYRDDIDALRGLSVLYVVIYHAFPEYLPGGFIGVDVFFVISGYLITSIILYSIEKNDFSLVDFYARRVRRLFPSLIAVLVLASILGWLVLYPDEYKQLGEHVSKSVLFWLNFTLINEVGYFDVESHYKPLLHLWTLSVEEQYYLLWPLMLLLFLKWGRKPAYLFFSVFLISLFANLYYIQDYTQETYYHTLSRFWQLAVGSLLAVALLNKQVGSSKLLALTGVVIISISAVFINSKMLYPGYWALLPVSGATLIILNRMQFPTYLGLSKLGLISYPLYLWHWVLISFVYIYLGRTPSNLVLALAVALSLVLSYLTYRYIEKLRYIKKATPYLILSLLVVGIMGTHINNDQGMPKRDHVAYFVNAGKQFQRTPAKDDACIEYSNKILGNNPIFNYCRSFNLDRKKIIAVVGDSHGHVLFSGVVKLANKTNYGVILLANSSCPPLKGFEWGKTSKERQECKTKIKQILKILKKNERIEKVVMATRGPVYIHGEVEGEFTEKSVEDSLSITKEARLTYDAYFNGFRETVTEIESIKHIDSMYYMLENPELDFLPKESMPRPFDYFNISTNRNFMRRSLYLKRMGVYRKGMLAVKSNKLTYLDPISAVCDEDNCYSFLEGNFLYADDDHFSVFGSEFIAKSIAKIVIVDE